MKLSSRWSVLFWALCGAIAFAQPPSPNGSSSAAAPGAAPAAPNGGPALPAAPAEAAPAAPPPSQTIQSAQPNGLRLTVYLPQPDTGYYRGSRFDWSGMVARADFAGRTVFGEWSSPHRPTRHDHAIGTAEEFGKSAPLGWAEANAGGIFVKIGVGELERPASTKTDPDGSGYCFHRDYRIRRPGSWTVTSGPDWIEFRQKLVSETGWSYEYTKKIQISPTGRSFVIDRRLTNLGERPIRTDHYGHNFVTVNARPVGPDYRVRFGFEPTVVDSSKLGDLAGFRGAELVFDKPIPVGKSILAELTGVQDDPRHGSVEVLCPPAKLSVKIRTVPVPKRFAVWAVAGALCPEPLVELEIAPGATVFWSTHYEFAETEPQP